MAIPSSAELSSGPMSYQGQCPARTSNPDSSSVQILRLHLSDLGDAPLTTLHPLTTPSEQARSRSYRFDEDRHRHLAGRGLVRAFMARLRGCPPKDVPIDEGPHGKPQLDESPEASPAFEFNIAHTDDLVLAAFSRDHPVGIDVEALDRDADLAALAQRVFTEQERRRWASLPDHDQSSFFFRVWTCKEAFLKALGKGLQRAPQTVECRFEGNTVVGLADAEDFSPPDPSVSASRWAVRSRSFGDGMIGAVVRKRFLPSSLDLVDAMPVVTQFSIS